MGYSISTFAIKQKLELSEKTVLLSKKLLDRIHIFSGKYFEEEEEPNDYTVYVFFKELFYTREKLNDITFDDGKYYLYDEEDNDIKQVVNFLADIDNYMSPDKYFTSVNGEVYELKLVDWGYGYINPINFFKYCIEATNTSGKNYIFTDEKLLMQYMNHIGQEVAVPEDKIFVYVNR